MLGITNRALRQQQAEGVRFYGRGRFQVGDARNRFGQALCLFISSRR
jgi:hypothetical protein